MLPDHVLLGVSSYRSSLQIPLIDDAQLIDPKDRRVRLFDDLVQLGAAAGSQIALCARLTIAMARGGDIHADADCTYAHAGCIAPRRELHGPFHQQRWTRRRRSKVTTTAAGLTDGKCDLERGHSLTTDGSTHCRFQRVARRLRQPGQLCYPAFEYLLFPLPLVDGTCECPVRATYDTIRVGHEYGLV